MANIVATAHVMIHIEALAWYILRCCGFYNSGLVIRGRIEASALRLKSGARDILPF